MRTSDAHCEYLVAGGGPAGALAARTLAEHGRDVLLADWRPREEKACGGGIPARGMTRFGALLEGTPRNEVRSIRLCGPRGDEAVVPLAVPLAIFARRDFDAALRRRAGEAGARVLAARVAALDRDEDGFRVELRPAHGPPQRLHARFLVAADGALGSVRRRLAELAQLPLPDPAHFSRTHTIYPRGAPPTSALDVMHIAYVADLDGYGWTFPRTDHASVGWCEQGARGGAVDLRERLGGLLSGGALAGAFGDAGVGALIPSYRGDVLRRSHVEGDRCALVGDAAGAVDPITREGIHHAMASGAALGAADPLAHPGRYAAWYDRELRPELVAAAGLAPRFFDARFLTLMVRSLKRSEALRDVFRDLVAGTQSYLALRRRLLASLPRTLGTLFVAALRP